ncbi:MAG: amidohydrolase [Firmicutes bacterium]|nr:amidohydrolase [Bacillota bacterium]
MIIDSHNHLGTRKGEHFPIEELLKWLENAGVDACVVTTHPEAINNDYVAEAQANYSDRIIGFAVVNPWDWEAESELERCLGTLNLKGLKLNPIRHGYALDRHQIVDPLFAICEKYHVPVLCHGGSDLFTMPGKFAEMAASFPKVPLILAHIGEPDAVESAIQVAKRYDNVYVDTAGIRLDTLKQAIEHLDPEKILMGTDASWGRFELSMELVRKATSDQRTRQLIMGENIAKLLSWPVSERS